MSNKITPIRANVTVDKETIPARTTCGQVVGTNGPTSDVWKSTPEIQASGIKLVAAGAALADAEALVQSLQAQIATAQNLRNAKVVEFDAAHGVYVAMVESYAETPQDFTSLGLTVFSKTTHPLAAPIGVNAAFDIAKRRLQIRVDKAPGMNACVVEISADASGAGPWDRLPGIGAVHKLSGYAPGTYLVRAASVRANEMSEFTQPVAVIVK